MKNSDEGFAPLLRRRLWLALRMRALFEHDIFQPQGRTLDAAVGRNVLGGDIAGKLVQQRGKALYPEAIVSVCSKEI